MFDFILNNPQYIMYAMIAAFLIVVVILFFVARANAQGSDTKSQRVHNSWAAQDVDAHHDVGDGGAD